jgi:hypothetical protein
LVIIVLGVGTFFGIRQYLFSSVVLQPEPRDALLRVTRVEGQNVYIVPWGLEDRRRLFAGYAVTKGDVVSTEKGSRLEIILFDGSKIRVNEDTTLYFSRLESGKPSHVSLNLLQGEIYIDTEELNHDDSDFIVITPQMISQSDGATFVIDTFPIEKVRVLEGVLKTSVFHVIGERKEPLTSVTLRIGEEISLDTDTVETLLSGEDYYPERFDVVENVYSDPLEVLEETSQPAWYNWDYSEGVEGAEGEESEVGDLGGVSEIGEDTGVSENEYLEESDFGNVSVIQPHEDQRVGSQVTVTGYFDKDRIAKIFVNGKQAVMDEEKEVWEASVTLTKREREIEVISEDMDGIKRVADRRTVDVDDEPPYIPEIIEPALDENNRGEVYGDSVVITGRAHSDIAYIIVTADSHAPYRLQKYSPGDDLYYYKASSAIGNLHEGSNIYTLQFFDSFENVSTLTVTLVSSTKPSPDDPLITIHEPPDSSYVTTDSEITVRGTIHREVKTLYVNEDVIELEGAEEFSLIRPLEVGENVFSIDVEGLSGERYKVGTFTIIRE